MKSKFILALLLVPAMSFAQVNNVGNCGWGAKLFDGQRGIAPQVLAVTTNGTSGNQTFAITSGTSGCTQDGVVKSSWKTAAYIDGNMNKLAKDMSRGQGESIDSLAALMEVPAAKKDLFVKTLKDNFSSVFSSTQASTPEVMSGIKAALASNQDLAVYSKNI